MSMINKGAAAAGGEAKATQGQEAKRAVLCLMDARDSDPSPLLRESDAEVSDRIWDSQ